MDSEHEDGRRANARFEGRLVAAGLARAMAPAIRLAELVETADPVLAGSARLLVQDVSQAARRIAWLRQRLEASDNRKAG